MEPRQHNNVNGDVASYVRRNAGSTGLAAACLLFFGFFRFSFQPVTDLFTLGDAVFNYTLRIGGVLMALIAVWSLTGHVSVLLADGIISIVIGALLAFSGVAMMIGAGGIGLNQVLYVVFGGMFISAGVRSWRYYLLVARTHAGLPEGRAGVDGSDAHSRDEPLESTSPESSLASQLLRRDGPPVEDDVPAPGTAFGAAPAGAAPSDAAPSDAAPTP